MSPKDTESGEELWRVFCAVELPREVRESAAERIERLRARARGVKASWDHPEKLHITLKFIGELEPARTHELSGALAQAAGGVGEFEMAIEGTGVFPPKGAPRVLWLGVRDAAWQLARLREGVEDECARRGFPRETRPFRPHLTIARLRAPAGTHQLAALHQQTPFTTEPFRVSEIVLMRSQLGPGGSRYTALSRHQLSQGR